MVSWSNLLGLDAADGPWNPKSLHLPLRPIEHWQRVCFGIEHPPVQWDKIFVRKKQK